MAWNPSPQVKAARDYGQKFGFEQVIIIGITAEQMSMGYASWGKTKVLCDNAKELADSAYDAIVKTLIHDV
jgi:hypothetical protein